MKTEFRKVLFVINKKSGTGYQTKLEGRIVEVCKAYDVECAIEFTRSRGHATELARQGVNEKFDMVVAVGGDGTLNEVAQGLINSGTAMGIIPKGSGNGLARHLGIPLNMSKCTTALLNSRLIKMDTFTINDKLSINVSGIGFDGHIASEFDKSPQRGLINYARITLKEFNRFKEFEGRIKLNSTELTRNAFIIAIANSSQYGNNAKIAPHASVCDGKLQLTILKKIPVYRFDVAYQMFSGKIGESKNCEILESSNFTIKTSQPVSFHVDGEPQHQMDTFTIKINPGSLTVVAPGLTV